jgi:toxin ParE1/3/4
MDERNGAKPQRLALYSPSAAADLALNHTSTAIRWGLDQADRYTALLQETAQAAADNPSLGKPVEKRPGVYSVLVKWRWRRSTAGHYVIYKPTEYGAYIVRILHSAMDLPRHIDHE